MIDPLFRICGSKNGEVLRETTSLLRYLLEDGDRFVEPFCGSCAVTLALLPKKVLVSDGNPDLIIALKALAFFPLEVKREFTVLQNFFLKNSSGENFYTLRDNPPSDPIQRAAWFLFVVKAAFNTLWRVNQKGKCNSPYGKKAGIQRVKSAMDEKDLVSFARFFRRDGVDVRFSDFSKTIAECGSGDLIYCDPPYVDQFDKYTKTPMGVGGHNDLVDALNSAWRRGAKVVVHGSSSMHPGFRDWMRAYSRKVDRKIAGGNKREKKEEWILISQPKQINLFEDPKVEEILCNFGEVEL